MIHYIKNEQHYELLIDQLSKVKHTLWIGTADLKDLYIKKQKTAIPFLALLEQKIKKGVSIRLLHAKEPGENFRNAFDQFPTLWTGMERALCPRIHFKMMVFDCEVAYIGSANLTGAGIGMKSDGKRNFEAGILTEIIEKALQNVGDNDHLLENQISTANEIIRLLSDRAEDKDLTEYQITKDNAELLSIYHKKTGEIPRPETSLSTSTLFTGSKLEPSMMNELKKEIQNYVKEHKSAITDWLDWLKITE